MRYFILTLMVLFVASLPALAADDAASLEKELQKLEAELPDILAEETDFDTREKYVDRILKLRAKIEALNNVADISNGKQYYKLVEIRSAVKEGEDKDGSNIIERTKIDKQNTTFVFVRDALGVKYNFLQTQSMGFNEYPDKITLGEPFTFKASTVAQKDISPGYCWTNEQQKLDLHLHLKTDYMGGAGYQKNVIYEVSDCKNSRSAQTVHAGGMINISVTCTPDNSELIKDTLRYNYTCNSVSADSKPVTGSTGKWDISLDLYVQVDAYNKPVLDDDGQYIPKPKKSKKQEFHVDVDSNIVTSYFPMRLVYVPFYADVNILENIGTVQHPVEVNNSVEQGEKTQESEIAVQEDKTEEKKDPLQLAQGMMNETLLNDPKKRKEHIKYWIKNAEPLENAHTGNSLNYEKWGRVEGKLVGGTIVVSGKPDDAEGWFPDPYEYVWAKADTLDSLNLCTLREYVERKLMHKETATCQKDAAQQSEIAAANSVSDLLNRQTAKNATMPNFVGQQSAKAKTDLEELGIEVQWRTGSIAKDTQQQGLIEKQKPRAGTDLKGVKEVELWAYSYATNIVTMPDVVGMTYEKAAKKLSKEGLLAAVGMTFKPQSKGEAGKVIAQQTKAGEKIKAGSDIILDIAMGGKKVNMPDVIGMSYIDASRKLNDLGLKPKYVEGPYPHQADLSEKVMKASLTPPIKIMIGAEIALTVYREYSAEKAPSEPAPTYTSNWGSSSKQPKEEKEQEKIVKSDPVSSFSSLNRGGSTSGTFKCDTGMGHIPVEASGRLYSKRKNGVLETDVNGEKNYICRYNMKGQSRVAQIAFYDKEPTSAAAKDVKSRLCAKNAMYKNLNHGKALTVYLATGAYFSNIGTDSQIERFINFHVDQIASKAISCGGNSLAASTNSSKKPPAKTGGTPSQFKCNTGFGLSVDRSATQNGVVTTGRSGEKKYECVYNAQGKKRTVRVEFFDTPQPIAKSYLKNQFCQNFKYSYPDLTQSIAIQMVGANITAAVGEKNVIPFYKFHVDQLAPYAIPCN